MLKKITKFIKMDNYNLRCKFRMLGCRDPKPNITWVVLEIRVPFRVLSIKVTPKRDPRLENYPHQHSTHRPETGIPERQI